MTVRQLDLTRDGRLQWLADWEYARLTSYPEWLLDTWGYPRWAGADIAIARLIGFDDQVEGHWWMDRPTHDILIPLRDRLSLTIADVTPDPTDCDIRVARYEPRVAAVIAEYADPAIWAALRSATGMRVSPRCRVLWSVYRRRP